ncbi:hypothetical protein HY417_03920 [Candidatus Kaiserbacteria bacterium]|nr:hypothetical protein [Candidatus Kaiserbacteria bacterium]
MIESSNRPLSLRDRTRILDDSPLHPLDKLEIAYLLLNPLKHGSFFQRSEGVGDEPPTEMQKQAFEQEWTDIRLTLSKLRVPYIVDRPLRVDEGFYRYRIIAAKKANDLQLLHDLVNAEETPEVAALSGKMMGYPATAIASYRASDAVDVKDLPGEEVEKLRAEKLLPFVQFALSRGHYREELGRVRIWQRLVRVHCPILFSELTMQ